MANAAYQETDFRVAGVSRHIGLGVAVVGLLVLFGWALDIAWLKSVVPGLATMKANTAAAFVLAGIALWYVALSGQSAASSSAIFWARSFAMLIGTFGLLTLAEYQFGWHLGIDQAVFEDPGAAAPGRMAAMTAVNFTLSAMAILLIDVVTGSGKRPSHWLMLLVAANSFLAVLGYLFGVEAFYRVVVLSTMALHTALLFIAFAIGLVCARPQSLLLRRIISDDAAGLINRRLLPAAVLIPPLLAWLVWQGKSAGYYSTVFGLALYATSNVAVLAALVWSSSSAVQNQQEQQLALTRTNVWQQAILNSADFTVISADKLGVIRTINRGAARKLGYLPEQLVNKRITDIIHDPEELATKAAALTKELGYKVEPGFDTLVAKARMIGCDESDWTYICQDGSRFFVRLSVSPLTDSYGKVSGFVAIGMDITEQRKAELALRESLSTLDDRNRELQDFAFVASHDLQEPLRKIRMFSDRLLQEYAPQLDDRANEYLRRNTQAATRMQTLIDDLTAYSRVATRGEHFRPVDLNRLVATVVDDLEARRVSSGGKVEWKGLPSIMGDAIQLRQVFQNLISNALKFRHPERAPLVRVLAEPLQKTHGASGWSIRVEDNGIGFDGVHAERIFAPFQRLHSRTEFEGTGIGLAIVRRIVERHGGRIVASALKGQGATFTITLPEISALPLPIEVPHDVGASS